MDQLPEEITHTYLAAIENELQKAIKRGTQSEKDRLYQMLAYHMGWLAGQAKFEARGKRFRPLLVLLTCSAAGGDWLNALPAAAAVELVHNFSLIHDDIEDHSPIRRGRPTVWKKWGIPQAINTGDALFTLAHLQVIRLSGILSPAAVINAVDILQQACLHLTQGQFLDLAYEKQAEVTLDEYWSMVEGKTAALISASTELGALAAFCDNASCQSYRDFGRLLGLAFQAHDDWLGIWGNSVTTGKSTSSDILSRKKTLPILYGLSMKGDFARRWKTGHIHQDEVYELISLLEHDGAKEFTQAKVVELAQKAIQKLDQVKPAGEAGEVLVKLTQNLLKSTA